MQGLPTTRLILILSAAALLLSGCCGSRRTVERWNTVTEVVERVDTVFVVHGDSVRQVLPLNLSRGFAHVVDHDLARVTIYIDTVSGTLTSDVVVHDRVVPYSFERVSTVTSKGRRVDVERTRSVWWRWLLVGAIMGAVIGWGVRSRLS